MVAAAIGATAAVASAAGGLAQAGSAGKAAGQQAQAQQQAAQLQYQMFEEQQANLKPYMDAGTAALPSLQGVPQANAKILADAQAAARGAIPLNVSAQTIQNMPGYQFNLDQGLKAVQNANAARGWGIGGEALKGAANFSTGLSNSYYQNYFNNQQGIFNDYNQLFSNAYNGINSIWNQQTYLPTLGENAAATSGYQANQAGANIGSNIAGAGQAQAAGTAAAGKAIGSSLANAPTAGLSAYTAANALFGPSAYTGPSASSLLTNAGDPASLQTALNLGSDQYVSDPRVKDIEGEGGNALDKINALHVYSAKYKDEPRGSERPMLMAPDVQRQLPRAVTGTPNGNALMTIRHHEITPLLVKGMQELSKKGKRH